MESQCEKHNLQTPIQKRRSKVVSNQTVEVSYHNIGEVETYVVNLRTNLTCVGYVEFSTLLYACVILFLTLSKIFMNTYLRFCVIR